MGKCLRGKKSRTNGSNSGAPSSWGPKFVHVDTAGTARTHFRSITRFISPNGAEPPAVSSAQGFYVSRQSPCLSVIAQPNSIPSDFCVLNMSG